MMAPGSAVEPGAIKRFRALLNEKRIVEVNEHNFKEWQEYFKARYNVEIPSIKKEVQPVKKDAQPAVTKQEAKPAKASVKATVK